MDETVTFDQVFGDPAELAAEIERTRVEIARSLDRIRSDQVEIELLRRDTQAILARLTKF